MLSKKDAEKLAKEIAEDLMTNGEGHKAERLVLELKEGRDGGGRCFGSVRDVIACHLERLEVLITVGRTVRRRG